MQVFNQLQRKLNLSFTQACVLEKINQLDECILRQKNICDLSKFYNIHRDTFKKSLDIFKAKGLLLESLIGILSTLPSYTSFIGLLQSTDYGILRFIGRVPSTGIIYSVDMFQDLIKQEILNNLKIGQYYYCSALIKLETNTLQINEQITFISFLGSKLTGSYLIRDIDDSGYLNSLVQDACLKTSINRSIV